MANKHRTVYYTGVTNNIENRVCEHKQLKIDGFTKRYNCTDLVYYKEYGSIEEAIATEKAIKNWKREWKEKLVLSVNPEKKDLSEEWDMI